jgi:Protein of unknown function (DUF3311)
MPQPEPGRPGRRPAVWAVVTVLLAIGVAGPIAVPLYARTGPHLGAFPFFYWYQLIWVPIDAVLVSAAYLLTRTPAPPARPEGER